MARVRVCALSGGGDGSLSLIGLISLEVGATGDLTGRTEPGASISFHFVEDAEVTIGVGLGGCCLLDAFDKGVCWSAKRDT